MPRHGMNKNKTLSIQLLNPRVYQPGDAVVGTVTIKLPKEAPPAKSVNLKLCGRAKTKITKRDGNGTRVYRGRAFYFQANHMLNASNSATQRDEEDGSEMVWPFDLEIPRHPTQCPASDKYDGATQPFLSNKDQENISQHELPSIFYYTGSSSLSGASQEAYVEYWLEASASSPSSTEPATYPLFVRRTSTETPTRDFDFATRQFPQAIASQRLLPEFAEQEKLTFRQRSRRFFAPSSVPRYTFRVFLNVAGAYQLDHPDPLPVRVWVVPMLGDDRTTIYDGGHGSGGLSNLPPVRLLEVEAEIKSDCHTRAPGSLSDHETSKSTKYPFGPATFGIGSDSNSAPVLPPSLDPESLGITNTSPFRKILIPPPANALDLGRILGLRISHRSAEFRGREQRTGFEKNNIYPSFATYNIALMHQLMLKLRIECAGERRTVEVRETPLRILPTAEQIIRAREEALGVEGMRKNYDDLEAAFENIGTMVEVAANLVSSVLGG